MKMSVRPELMRPKSIRPRHVAAAAMLAASVAWLTTTAMAAPVAVDRLAIAPASPGGLDQVRWRGGGWGWGGAPYYGGYYGGGYYTGGPYYGGPYYYDYEGRGYGGAPRAYVEEPGDDADVSYCAQRFKSYDPRSGTYRGKDGKPHPCP
jgi:uncharacterized membrane protein